MGEYLRRNGRLLLAALVIVLFCALAMLVAATCGGTDDGVREELLNSSMVEFLTEK